MKTIKIIGSAWPFRGGIATYNERLANEFIREGYSVNIETFTLQYPSVLFPGKTQYSPGGAPDGLDIKRTVNSINPLNWLKVGKRIKKEKPDLVIIPYWLPFMAPCLGTIAGQIRKNGHSKLICLAHNIIPHEKRTGDNAFTGYFLKRIDAVVAQSKSVVEDTYKLSKNLPVSLSPHPLYDNFGELIERKKAVELIGLDPAFNYILFFGFIRDYKGLDLLIEAISDHRLSKLNVKAIIAGEFYSDPEPYHKLIRELNVQDKLIMKTEFISDDNVNKFFCAADIIVQPYKHATQSGVTQIGYHFNKPMLVTNVGGLPEIIPHNVVGYVVEPEKKMIADALVDFFTNDKKATFESNILIEKKKFLWSNMTNTIRDLAGKIPAKGNEK